MKVNISATGKTLGKASAQLLSNNIESYENTIPSMLSDRLRNAKFAGPVNLQTGVAAEWEPLGNCMGGVICKLVPGMYMSGHEAQLIQCYLEEGQMGILQAGVHVREGEEFEIEMWARAHDRPVKVEVSLKLPGRNVGAEHKDTMTFDLAHWHRRTCRIKAPGTCDATYFNITIGGDCRVLIDQVHMRPVGQTHVSQEMLNAFDKFPCPVLRFPGGCVTCTYHWEHGIGPVQLRPVCDDPVFKYKLYYDFGTDEYLDLCVTKNIRPFITLNTTTATPEQCAAWAAYVRNWYVSRKLEIPAAYFMFGNENYGTWEIGHMTGEMYVAQLAAMVPLVRAVYPEARILALGEWESGGIRKEYATPWRSTVIEKAAGLFDMLVVTRYTWGSDSTAFPQTLESIADQVADKVSDLEKQAQSIRNSKLDCTMAVVEWNYWTRASHNDHSGFYEPNDIRHCLYAAAFINAFCRMGDILEIANYYSLVNTMGMIHVHHGEVQLSDIVKVMNLYAEALPGTTLELDVNAPKLTEKSKVLDANFIRKGAELYGFLVNYSATESVTVDLQKLGMIIAAKGLTADGILKPVQEIDIKAMGEGVTVPPASIVRVTCRG